MYGDCLGRDATGVYTFPALKPVTTNGVFVYRLLEDISKDASTIGSPPAPFLDTAHVVAFVVKTPKRTHR